jgi:membrane-associated phospholipid phosphatase
MDGDSQRTGQGGEAQVQSPRKGFWHPRNWVALLRGRPIIVVLVVLATIFLLLTALVIRADLRPTEWDLFITANVQYLPEAPYGFILRLVSDPGYWPWSAYMAVLIAGIMIAGRWFVEAAFTAVAALSGYSAEIVKNLVDRPRPTPDFARVAVEHTSFSFPSGHVTMYAILFGFLFYLAYTLLPRHHPARWAALIVCGLLIVLVAPSRIWLGAHWASDTLAGYALGFSILLLIIEGYRVWQKRHLQE